MLTQEECLSKIKAEYGIEKFDAEPSFFQSLANLLYFEGYFIDKMNESLTSDDMGKFTFWYSKYLKHEATLGSYYSQMRRVVPNIEITQNQEPEDELEGVLKTESE